MIIQPKKSKSKYTGLFRELVEDMGKRNPIEYRLPTDIINFFENGKCVLGCFGSVHQLTSCAIFR